PCCTDDAHPGPTTPINDPASPAKGSPPADPCASHGSCSSTTSTGCPRKVPGTPSSVPSRKSTARCTPRSASRPVHADPSAGGRSVPISIGSPGRTVTEPNRSATLDVGGSLGSLPSPPKHE